jgi:hypothetical protein
MPASGLDFGACLASSGDTVIVPADDVPRRAIELNSNQELAVIGSMNLPTGF